jgi:hypothetical protein
MITQKRGDSRHLVPEKSIAHPRRMRRNARDASAKLCAKCGGGWGEQGGANRLNISKLLISISSSVGSNPTLSDDLRFIL